MPSVHQNSVIHRCKPWHSHFLRYFQGKSTCPKGVPQRELSVECFSVRVFRLSSSERFSLVDLNCSIRFKLDSSGTVCMSRPGRCTPVRHCYSVCDAYVEGIKGGETHLFRPFAGGVSVIFLQASYFISFHAQMCKTDCIRVGWYLQRVQSRSLRQRFFATVLKGVFIFTSADCLQMVSWEPHRYRSSTESSQRGKKVCERLMMMRDYDRGGGGNDDYDVGNDHYNLVNHTHKNHDTTRLYKTPFENKRASKHKAF